MNAPDKAKAPCDVDACDVLDKLSDPEMLRPPTLVIPRIIDVPVCDTGVFSEPEGIHTQSFAVGRRTGLQFDAVAQSLLVAPCQVIVHVGCAPTTTVSACEGDVAEPFDAWIVSG